MAAPQPMALESDDVHFSRLESSFGQTKVAPRKNSIEMKDVSRHTQAGDLNVSKLEFNFLLDRIHYPLDSLQSLQDVFPAVQHYTLFTSPRNISDTTQIRCFDIDENNASLPSIRHFHSSPPQE
jgi:hypothetical protein